MILRSISRWCGWPMIQASLDGDMSLFKKIKLNIPSGNLTQLLKMAVFNGNNHYKCPCSMIRLVYQRVVIIERRISLWILLRSHRGFAGNGFRQQKLSFRSNHCNDGNVPFSTQPFAFVSSHVKRASHFSSSWYSAFKTVYSYKLH